MVDPYGLGGRGRKGAVVDQLGQRACTAALGFRDPCRAPCRGAFPLEHPLEDAPYLPEGPVLDILPREVSPLILHPTEVPVLGILSREFQHLTEGPFRGVLVLPREFPYLPEGPVQVEHVHVARHAVTQHVPWDGLAVEPEGRRRGRSGRKVASTGQTEDIKPQRGCSITADQQFPHRYDDPCPNLL